jgi:two-component system phosphate regulon sensor histidine kinase PhoR
MALAVTAMWANLGIRSRILIYYILVALIPLISIDFIWYHSSQSQLKTSASDRQALLLTESGKRLNQALTDKINDVVNHSEEASYVNFNADQVSTSLLRYAFQDSDIKRAAVTDAAGIEQVVVQDGKVSRPLTDASKTDGFLAIRRVTSEPYVSPLTYKDGKPYLTISVPILAFNRLGDQQLTEAQALARRFGSDIKGALIVNVGMQSLLQSVLTNKVGSDGYIYIVNSQGQLIAHPDAAYRTSNPEIKNTEEVTKAVKVLGNAYLKDAAAGYRPEPTPTTSERNVAVLSSYYPLSATRWAIIGEEPVAAVYSSAHGIWIIALMILLLAIPVSLALILLATRNIISPIRELTEGAVRIGNGDFTYKLHAKSHDEVGTLAATFSAMGTRLEDLIGQYKAQNITLLAERSKLQAVLNTITDGIIALDRNYNIVLVNKMIDTLTLLTDVREMYGKPWLQVFSLMCNDKPLRNEQLEGEFSNFENVTLRFGDQVKHLNLTAVKLAHDPNGIAFIITVHDVTQSRELEAMRLDFVSMAAHELRTPLTAVRGYLELAKNDTIGAQGMRKYVERAMGCANTLAALINNILSLSRIERNAMKLNITRLHWNDIIESEVRNHSFIASAKDIQITAELPEEPVELMGDELSLREVIGNFISNAIHYTEAGGKITIRIETQGDTVKTTVADTGIGISPEALDKLFSKYYRASGGLTTNSQGTGIGLFISKSIIEAQHGTVGVDSVVGQGTQFYFILPKAAQQAVQKPSESTTITERGGKVEWF